LPIFDWKPIANQQPAFRIVRPGGPDGFAASPIPVTHLISQIGNRQLTIGNESITNHFRQKGARQLPPEKSYRAGT